MASNDNNTQPGRDDQAVTRKQSDSAGERAGNAIESTQLTSGAPASAKSDSGRQERIAKAAYSKAEQRGFAPGADWDDWFDAEREVDREIEQLTTKSNLPED